MVEPHHFRRPSLDTNQNEISDTNNKNNRSRSNSSENDNSNDFTSVASRASELVTSTASKDLTDFNTTWVIFEEEWEQAGKTWPVSSDNNVATGFSEVSNRDATNDSECEIENVTTTESAEKPKIESALPTTDHKETKELKDEDEATGEANTKNEEEKKKENSGSLTKAAIGGAAVIVGGTALLSKNALGLGENDENIEKVKGFLGKAAKVVKKFADDGDDVGDVPLENCEPTYSGQAEAEVLKQTAAVQAQMSSQSQLELLVARRMAIQAISNMGRCSAYVITATSGSGTAGVVTATSAAAAFTISTSTAVTIGLVATATAAALAISLQPTDSSLGFGCKTPDIYSGNLVLRLGGVEGLTLFERDYLGNTTKEVYNQVLGGCEDTYQRFADNIEAVDEKLIISNEGNVFLDISFAGIIQCNECHEFEPFFGIPLNVTSEPSSTINTSVINPLNQSNEQQQHQQQQRRTTEDKFVQFVRMMEARLKNLFQSVSGGKLVFFAELNMALGEETEPVGICNIDPEINAGKIAIRLYTNRTLRDKEKLNLGNKIEQVYGGVAGGCNGPYERFSNNIIILKDTLVTENGVTFLDIEISGLVQCEGCNSFEPFFGAPSNDVSDSNTSLAEDTFSEFVSTLQVQMDDVFSTSETKDLVYVAEVNTLTGEFATRVQLLPEDFCDIDPDIYSGTLVIRSVSIDRELTLEEMSSLSTIAEESYNEVVEGCDDIYQRFADGMEIISQDIVSEGDISFLDTTITGRIRCRGCNEMEPFFGVVPSSENITVMNEMKTYADDRLLNFVSLMAVEFESMFGLINGGDLVYIVELNTEDGVDNAPAGVCNIDPEINTGKIAIRLYTNRTLGDDERASLAATTEQVYSEVVGGCIGEYERFGNAVKVTNETLVTENGVTFLDVEISGLVQCEGCNSFEPFFGAPSNDVSDSNTSLAEDTFSEFVSTLQVQMDDVFSTSETKDLVYVAEVNTLTGEFATGVQLLPEDFCDIDPDIYSGTLVIRSVSIDREFTLEEMSSLSTIAEESYNEVIEGCDDIYQRFADGMEIISQDIVSEGDISFLDTTITGRIRCRSCNEMEPFFGVVPASENITVMNEMKTYADDRLLNFVSLMAVEFESMFGLINGGDLVYIVELNTEDGVDNAPAGVCNIDPEINTGKIAIRLYTNRTLGDDERASLAATTEQVYSEVVGGCIGEYERFGNAVKVTNETLVTENGVTFLDVEISGLVQCEGCNSFEPFFGAPSNDVSDSNTSLAEDTFSEFVSTLQVQMDDVFSTSETKDLVYVAEVNTLTGEFATGVQLLPEDFCDIDPDIYSGTLVIRSVSIDREFTLEEMSSLSTIAEESYNEVIEGCDDIYQRFADGMEIISQDIVSEGDISFLDTTITGRIRCRSCNEMEPFFGVVPASENISVMNEMKTYADDRLLNFVSLMAVEFESMFGLINGGDLVYIVELNTEDGVDNAPAGVCNIDPEINTGKIAIHLYTYRTLGDDERASLAATTEQVYSEVVGGCIGEYERFGNAVKVTNETLVTENGVTFLDVEISGLVQCEGCNSFEPFFGAPSNDVSDSNTSLAEDTFSEFVSTLQVQMDDVFSTSETKDLVYVAEVNTLTGKFATGVQLLPEDFCDIDPDIYSGTLVIRSVSIDREFSLEEMSSLSTIAEESYNEVIEGCDDIYQRFADGMEIISQDIVSEGDISFLDTTITGRIRCRSCNEMEPFFGVVPASENITVMNEMKTYADDRLLNFVSLMAVEFESMFGLINGGDLVYIVELNTEDGVDNAPAGVCNIDPEINTGKIAIHLYTNRTLGDDERASLAATTEQVYSEVVGGCIGEYERFGNAVKVTNETLVTENGVTFLDVEISGLVQCEGCNSFEPFFGEPSNDVSDPNTSLAEDTFFEFVSTLQVQMDEVFSTSETKDLVYVAEVNTLTGEFAAGVQLLPEDFCDIDPDIYSGTLVIRSVSIDRELTLEEMSSLSTIAEESYNEVIEGCDDIYQRFADGMEIISQDIVSEGDISFLDTTITGRIRCRGCNEMEPFFGVVPASENITVMNEMKTYADDRLLNFVSLMAVEFESMFGLINGGDLVYIVELNAEDGVDNAPAGVCNIDPEINTGKIAIRLYTNRTLGDDERASLAATTEQVYSEVVGGCIGEYERFGNAVKVTNETLVTENGVTFLDVEISGLVQCEGCNSFEPFFGEPSNDVSDSNTSLVEDTFSEFVSTLQVQMDEVFSTSETKDLVYVAEVNTLTGDFATGLQILRIEEPSTSPSYFPKFVPSVMVSLQPSSSPTLSPSSSPSVVPSLLPSSKPSELPTGPPSKVPSFSPTFVPTIALIDSVKNGPWMTFAPSVSPSESPSNQPSSLPSSIPSHQPSRHPSSAPSHQPSRHPSSIPSHQPSRHPSSAPSHQPSRHPSSIPSHQPSRHPSSAPSHQPSAVASMLPSVAPSCNPASLQVVDVTEYSGGGTVSCSKEYNEFPIIVESITKGKNGMDDGVRFSVKQTFRKNNNLQFLYMDFWSRYSPSSLSSSRSCFMEQAISFESIVSADESAKCMNGFAEVHIYARDNNWYLSNDDTALIPDRCKAPGQPNFKCGWKFQISCSC